MEVLETPEENIRRRAQSSFGRLPLVSLLVWLAEIRSGNIGVVISAVTPPGAIFCKDGIDCVTLLD